MGHENLILSNALNLTFSTDFGQFILIRHNSQAIIGSELYPESITIPAPIHSLSMSWWPATLPAPGEESRILVLQKASLYSAHQPPSYLVSPSAEQWKQVCRMVLTRETSVLPTRHITSS